MVYDVAIVGSGPAGASAALELAKNGVKTVIIEKEKLPRYKTCGGGFVYRGRKNLPFDISSIVEREFNKIDIIFQKDGIHLTAEREQPIVTMIMRDEFDNLLVEKAKEFGVDLLEESKLKKITFGDKQHVLHTTKGDVTAQYIVAADGALSTTAKLAGWEETRLLIPALEYEVEVTQEDFERLNKNVRFDFDAVSHGYGWCFPKKNHLSIGLASTKRTNIDLKKLYKEYLLTLGIKEVVSESLHGFQIPVTPRTDSFVKERVFLIGDAAGFADPVTAEGISNAILSGNMVANAIVNSNGSVSKAEENYQNELNETLLPELKTGIRLAKLFYEQHTARKFLMKHYGESMSQSMTKVFMGEMSYPKDVMASLKTKLKKKLLFQ